MPYQIIAVYLILVNAAGFVLMLMDKRRAIKGAWRVSESTLLAVAILGGSIGSIFGMYTFRHKTRHLKFKLGLPLILIAQLLLIFRLA